MWGQTVPSVSLASAALAALVHAGFAAALFLLPDSAGRGDGPATTIIPVTLVAPVIEAPAPEPVLPPEPEPVPEPEEPPGPPADIQAPGPKPQTEAETASLPDVADMAQETPVPDAARPEPVEPSGPAAGDSVASSAEKASGVQTETSAEPVEAPGPGSPDVAPPSTDPRDGRKRSPDSGRSAMTDYLIEVRRQLSRHAPKAVPGARDCEVEFHLSQAGELTFRAIRTSSGSPRYDRRCLKAVQSAAPYPSAPPHATGNDLRFTIIIKQRR
ncbi:TonB family protein [Henriciella aquimarina]|uniref:TonB family protein n=1 Tax=Henriciella aquimarina TaxID=545261 RepID=UPI000A0173B8|nr:TonB family protein [Henriciella aquimarina]